MNKDKLQAAINAMQDGADVGYYNDELATLLSLVINASDADIAAAWSEVSEQPQEVQP